MTNINCTGIKISNLRCGLSRDQQQQEPSEQPEQPPDEADHGRGDGGHGHPGHAGHVGHGHPGRCQPPLISVATSLGFHHHCLLPTKQEISEEIGSYVWLPLSLKVTILIFLDKRSHSKVCGFFCATYPAARPPTTEPKSQELKVMAMSMRK